MAKQKNLSGTGSIPLQFAKEISDKVNAAWEDGSYLEKVSPITKDLLRFWFGESFCDTRKTNFHQGQKQSILKLLS